MGELKKQSCLLLLPEWEILGALKEKGAEVGMLVFRDTQLWVILWEENFYIGQTLRETAKEMLVFEGSL